ncbi:unnamed protein product [Nyctereutes procyonoides]|uniref:(raccoon dog) hypothetical protein n=1 Tax=Nyctereutes procyonoides TaxID=34880 RepID=A0A811YE56_NYCPR|nr:unnamed protein product [Nyctereutes procyonoides]
MSFTTCSTFSSNYQSLGSRQSPSHRLQTISSSAAMSMQVQGARAPRSLPSCRDGWGTGRHRGYPGREGDHARPDLASYLERGRSLEADDQKPEMKTREHLEKKGPQIFASAADNACIVLQIDNARLAVAMRQSVESDIHRLCKVIDDTNVTGLQLKTEIEALKEELLFAKKNHEEELDAPKSQDLGKIMADIRAQYDELAQKIWEQLDKYWSQQIEESTMVVTTQTAEIREAEMTLMEQRHTTQSLEINLDSVRNLKASLKNSLREVETCYAMQMEQLNGGQCQAQEYEALLNVKVKLEAEIATYFLLMPWTTATPCRQTIQKTSTHKIVDSKVVSETNNTKILRR